MKSPSKSVKKRTEAPSTGTLFVVSTPIGDSEDITLRALKTLKKADAIVAEEGKIAARLLAEHLIAKDIHELNEHNETTQTPELLSLLQSGKFLALVSDCGTPLLADPGAALVQKAIEAGITVQALPGASSILTALVTSGLPMQEFVFAGFVSREPAERRAQFKRLALESRTVILLETPYRLLPLLQAASEAIPERRAYVGCNLTMLSETHHYGTLSELYAKFTENKFKGEFVLCFAGTGREAAPSRAVEALPEGASEEVFERPRRAYGERKFEPKPYGERKFGEKKFGEKKFGEKKFEDKSYSEERPRRAYSERKSGEKKFGEKKFGDKPYGERKFGEKKFGDKPYSEERPRRAYGERKFGEKKFEEKKFGDKPYGERKFGEKKFGEKPYGERKFGEKKFGEKKFSEKKFGEKKFGEKKFGSKAAPRRKPTDRS
jgi:16S rRNA (cytidine1402-2'-O)-methyltransferase